MNTLGATTDQGKVKQTSKRRVGFDKNVTDASLRFTASRQEDRPSTMSPEKRQAVIDLFTQMQQMEREKNYKVEGVREIDKATRKLATLLTLVNDEISAIRKVMELPELSGGEK